jgi:hypothetical protein
MDVGGTAPLRAGVTTTVAGSGGGVALVATLKGAGEVPGPGDPDGAGQARLDLGETQVCVHITVSGLDAPTAAHIHTGAAGLAGPVLVPLPVADGCAPVTASQRASILAAPAGFYVNVHTTAFPNGAVRGQLTKG